MASPRARRLFASARSAHRARSRRLIAVVAVAGACSSPHRELSIVTALPGCVPAASVNSVHVTALGDFPPKAPLTAAASAEMPARLELPRATRVVAVEGFGAPRQGPTATGGLVAFGRTAPLVLDDVKGGTLPIAYGPPNGLCATGAMHFARSGHQATLLASGNVLISGGVGQDGNAVAPLELYLPLGDATTPPAHFRVAASTLPYGVALAHAVAALADGGALLAGGVGSDASGAPHGRAFAGAVRVDGDGQIVGQPRLLAGGPRAGHSATRLADGRVLLAGGCARWTNGACNPGEALATTELYDPESDRFVPGPPLVRARFSHDALLRGDGTVLLVGGLGDKTLAPPVEVIDPVEARGFDAGAVGGRGVMLASGSVLVAAGSASLDAQAALWLSPGESPLPLPPLGDARRAPTLTALDDGAVLIAGGGSGPLLVFDGRGGIVATPTSFAVSGHAAARLFDGTVLLAGGVDASGSASANAAVYFRSPLSAWSSLPPLVFDGAANPYLPRRPDRAFASGGRLRVVAPAPSSDGRPTEYALVAGMLVGDFSLEVLVGRAGAAAAAVLVGWTSEAAYDWVTLAPGAPVALLSVRSPVVGQVLATAVSGCAGATLDAGALPDGDVAPFSVAWRSGTFTVASAGRSLLRCRPSPWPRGAVGVGASRGTAVFSGLQLSR